MTKFGTLFLFGLSALLAGVIWFELQPRRDKAELPTARQPIATQAEIDGESVDPAIRQTWVRSLLARPLLAASRRPEAEKAATASATPTTSIPRISGIVIYGEYRSVTFAGEHGGRPVTVVQGGYLGTVQVVSIDADRVVVTGLGDQTVLRPTFDPSPPSIQAAAVPLLPVPPVQTSQPNGLAAFNGPAGLDRMPKFVATPGPGLPGLPGLPSLSNLTGIPGLDVPGTAPKP